MPFNPINPTEDELYYPPEYYDENREKACENFDIWSLACIFCLIIYGKKPFENTLSIKNNSLPRFVEMMKYNFFQKYLNIVLLL